MFTYACNQVTDAFNYKKDPNTKNTTALSNIYDRG